MNREKTLIIKILSSKYENLAVKNYVLKKKNNDINIYI